MILSAGKTYFIKDEFFEKIADPYLKINYETTKRPHYLGLKDEKEDLYWMIPLSSRIEKFQKIIDDKKRRNKPADGIQIMKIQDKTVALLFQDMFPITEKYIDSLYIRNGEIFCISDPRKIIELEKHAKKVSRLLEKIRFTPTQPDTKRIYQIMKEEQQKENRIKQNNIDAIEKHSLGDILNNYTNTITEPTVVENKKNLENKVL